MSLNLTLEKSLLSQLKQFGLNPSNWSLKPVSKSLILIDSLDEDGFQFIGSIHKKKGQIVWTQLQLAAI